MTDWVVYRMFDADDVLLYVGMTSDIGKRLLHHKTKREEYGEVGNITLRHYSTREEAADAERLAIFSEHPRWNKLVVKESAFEELDQAKRRRTAHSENRYCDDPRCRDCRQRRRSVTSRRWIRQKCDKFLQSHVGITLDQWLASRLADGVSPVQMATQLRKMASCGVRPEYIEYWIDRHVKTTDQEAAS